MTVRILSLNLLLLLFFAGSLKGQVVDIERQRLNSEEKGLHGAANVSGSYLDNDEVIYSLKALGNLQYRVNNHLFLLIGDYKISRSTDTDFQDAAFLHLRYNRTVSSLITTEAFMQIQDDKISLLKYRFLAGAGARIKIVSSEPLLVNFGVIPMYEFEELLDDAFTTHQDIRISQYLNTVIGISETLDFYSTTYFQPVYNLWEDFRLHNESRLQVTLTQKTNLSITNTYSWDANPPIGAPKRRMNLNVGFGIDF